MYDKQSEISVAHCRIWIGCLLCSILREEDEGFSDRGSFCIAGMPDFRLWKSPSKL